MAKVNIACPNCGNQGEVDESYLGRKAQCNKCKTAFVFQRMAEPAPVAPVAPAVAAPPSPAPAAAGGPSPAAAVKEALKCPKCGNHITIYPPEMGQVIRAGNLEMPCNKCQTKLGPGNIVPFTVPPNTVMCRSCQNWTTWDLSTEQNRAIVKMAVAVKKSGIPVPPNMQLKCNACGAELPVDDIAPLVE